LEGDLVQVADSPQGQGQAAPGSRHTYIFDPENAAELARLERQGILVTTGMGGILPEWDNTLPAGIERVIDLGCGPGDWARQVASRSPQADVTGLDVSAIMVAFAQERAEESQLANAHFMQGNLLEPLDLPDASFDLVNERLLGAVLRRERWPEFLQECLRVTKAGGRMRATEPNEIWRDSQPAWERFTLWERQMFDRGGYGFGIDIPQTDLNLAPTISKLMAEVGWSEVVTQEYVVDFSFGSDLYEGMCQNVKIATRGFEPIMLRLGITTAEEFQQTYIEMVREMESEHFKGYWRFYTISARKP
jgi:ubiquinone/menaquinone biosynthesis C-methylase UbiE